METLLSDSTPFVSDGIEVHCAADILLNVEEEKRGLDNLFRRRYRRQM